MSANGTLGTLLQGVSQQPPAVRANGTVTEQVNFTSDVVQGLTARPALHELHATLGFSVTDYAFMDVDLGGTRYIVGYKPGAMTIWDLDGVEQTLLAPVGGGDDPLSYIGQHMRSYVFSGKLFMSNRDIVVQKAAAADTSEVFFGAGIAYCLGGIYSREYKLTITYDDGTVATGSYTTPDGTGGGDAQNTAAPHIAGEVVTALNADPALKAETTVYVDSSTIGVEDTTNSFTLRAYDGEDDQSFRSFTQNTENLEDLSETGFHGMIVRITNNDEGSEDDYLMRFNSETTITLGGGFGGTGVWEEWYDVTEVSDFDLSTMPHVLEKTGPAEFTMSKGDWKGRRVGDEKVNPFLSFVGHPIRDIGGFQSRLVVVAGSACSMSRSNEPFDFFKESALTNLSTDPIDITTTEEGEVSLDWIVPFDRDIVFMTDPGAGQYVITGNSKLTPDNASMVKTTAFEMRGGAKPVGTGRTVLFPFKSGAFSGVKEFFTNDEIATNGADTLTETADRYIVGLIDHIQCSTNFNMAVFKTAEAGYERVVWVYKYLWQGSEKLQSAWSKLEFPHPVKHFFFEGSELFVVMQDVGADGTSADIITAALDLDIPSDPVADFHICLDRQITEQASASSEVLLPYSGAAFVQSTGCATPGKGVTPIAESARDTGTGLVTYTFEDGTVPTGATLVCGLPYARRVSPTMPFVRGRDGSPRPRTRLIVNSFMMEYENTGYFKVTMDSRYRQDPIVFEVNWFAMDNDPDDYNGTGLRSGILNVPWGERSDWGAMTIYSDDVRPTTILEIEWTGQIFKGSRE